MQRSLKLNDGWLDNPELYYGYGIPISTPIFRKQVPPASMPTPAATPLVNWNCFVEVYSDGAAIVSAMGNGHLTGFLPPPSSLANSFYVTYGGEPVSRSVSILVDNGPSQPKYHLSVHVHAMAQPHTAAGIITSSPEYAAPSEFDFLTSEIAAIRQELANPSSTPPAPLDSSSQFFDDLGNPLQHYYRAVEFATDSNFDGIADSTAIAGGTSSQAVLANIYSINPSSGVHNAYLWNSIFSTPILNEANPSNTDGPLSADGERYDWVEIYNPTTSSVNLAGWRLVNGGSTYTLPSGSLTTLGSGEFLLVFCSGLGSGGPAGEVHASFKLNVDNMGTLQLRRPNNSVADTLGSGGHPDFDGRAGISYGRWPDATAITLDANGNVQATTGTEGYLRWRYFAQPTPGAHNHVAAYEGITPEPQILAHPSGQPSDGGVFYDTTVEVTLNGGGPDSVITYTTNAAEPSWRSTGYDSGTILEMNRSTVLRASAHRPGWLPSRSLTRSFLFKESVLGTAPEGTSPTDHQVRPPGYPQWVVDQEPDTYEMEYAMTPIRISTYKGQSETDTDGMLYQLTAIPSVAITMPVADIFEQSTGGIYADSDIASDLGPVPRNGSFEWIDPTNGDYKQDNADIEISGGSSLRWAYTAKKSLEIKFRKRLSLTSDGNFEFPRPPFAPLQYDNGRNFLEFDRLRARNTSQDSWAAYSSNFSLPPGEDITYLNNAYYRSLGDAMGHLVPRARWVHLYLNGLYWGLYELIEPVDDRILSDHDIARTGVTSPAAVAQYDPSFYEIADVSNSDCNPNAAFELDCLIQDLKLNEFDASDANGAAWARIQDAMDIENYVETFLIANLMQIQDLSVGNVVPWRNTGPAGDGKFRFILWDSDYAFEPDNATTSSIDLDLWEFDFDSIHYRLQGFPPYQRLFAQCLQERFIDAGSALKAPAPANRWIALRDTLSPLIDCEAARWGDARTGPGALTGYFRQHWTPRVNTEIVPFINAKDDFAQMQSPAQAVGVWPGKDGPEVEIILPGQTTPILSPGGRVPRGTKVRITAPNPTDVIFYRSGEDDLGVIPDPLGAGHPNTTGTVEFTLDVPLVNPPFGQAPFSVKARVGTSGLTQIQFAVTE